MATLFQRVTAANALETMGNRAADEKSYHLSKYEHYCSLACAARVSGSIAEAVALERMADRHEILSRS